MTQAQARAQATQRTFATVTEVIAASNAGEITPEEAGEIISRMTQPAPKQASRMMHDVRRYEAGQTRGREGFELGEARVDLRIGLTSDGRSFTSEPKGRRVLTLTRDEWAYVLTSGALAEVAQAAGITLA